VISQSSEIALQSQNLRRRKTEFSKKSMTLKGLKAREKEYKNGLL